MSSSDFIDIDSSVPSYLRHSPFIRNSISTPTTNLQNATERECLPFLEGLNSSSSPFDPFLYMPNGLLTLQRPEHIEFLHDALSDYPAPFVGIDASRPWMVYWGLTALYFLGVDLTPYRDQVVKTFYPLQNPSGGYGGGQGHLSHLAGTYATLLSLALIGGEDAWQLTDREAMWKWLGRLKQPSGGFTICVGGEEDARGAYCAIVAIVLLNLPWDLPPDSPGRRAGFRNFGDGLGSWLSRCQTYEGGMSANPGSEAHGAYAFCATACLCLLDSPDHSLADHIDIEALIGWLSSRQYAPEGGLAGRTNKVVDGCYSHWLGGIWPLVQAALEGPRQSDDDAHGRVGNLYSTEGLARYILNCCQNPEGGLRDKPSKGPDSYHTCYTLAGLSNIEHYHYYTSSSKEERFAWAFEWKVVRNSQRDLDTARSLGYDFEPKCDMKAVHPVFMIPHEAVAGIRRWALMQERDFGNQSSTVPE